MKSIVVPFTSAVCLAILAALVLSPTRSAQGQGAEHSPEATPPTYNPYPAGILPADLNSEIARVQREVNFIENEALTESHTP
jgi:hypothetical protein